MKILFLAPRLPLPADTGGKIRTFNILKQLARFHELTLLCFSFESDDSHYLTEFKVMNVAVHLVPMPESSLIKKVMGVLCSNVPFSIAKYDVPAMRQAINNLLKQNTFDAVHVDHLHMAVYANCFSNIPLCLDEHNVEYKILERCASVENFLPKKWLYENQAIKMRNIERTLLKHFKRVFACSDDDKQLLEDLTSTSAAVSVIPNGVDTLFFQNENNASLEKALVFTGSMDWLPNDDAITYFCKDILPLVWLKDPQIKLYVVGKNPSQAITDLASRDQRVVVTGRVEDVRPYIEKASIFIVPLRIGGGTRLKILEAMAMGKAVVSTTIGAEGIKCVDGQHIALADKPEQFAQYINNLMNDPLKIKTMGKQGRELVVAAYEWSIVGHQLNEMYNKG